MADCVCERVLDILTPLLEARVPLPGNRVDTAGRVLFDEVPVPINAARESFQRTGDSSICGWGWTAPFDLSSIAAYVHAFPIHLRLL